MRYSPDKLISLGVEAAHKAGRWLGVHAFSGATGVSDSTVRRAFGSCQAFADKVKLAYQEKYGTPGWEVEREERRQAFSFLNSQNRRDAHLALLVKACEQAISRLDRLPSLPRPKPRKLKAQAQQMHLVISDVHIGEKTEPIVVGGLGGYDFGCFKERLAKLQHKVLDTFCKQVFGALKLDTLVVNFLGDMVTGEIIYPGQQMALDRCLVDQVFEGVEYFARFLHSMAAAFPKVEVFAVAGNHGRAGRKRDGVSTRTNFDYILYRCLAERLRDVANIDWYISESPFLIVKHGEHNFYLHHGDNVRGWMGLPYYGLDRKVRKITSMTGIPIHYLMIGHHHREATISIPHGRLFVNGAWPGGSELSINRLDENAIPKQLLYIYHPQEGVHSVSDIHLAEPIQLKADKRGLYTPTYRGNGRKTKAA